MCCLYENTQFDMSLLFSELIHTQQEVKLFGPAFSSPAIWSVVFQILHFPGLAFSIAPPETLGNGLRAVYSVDADISCC